MPFNTCEHTYSPWYYTYNDNLYNTECLTGQKPMRNMDYYERQCSKCLHIQAIYDMKPQEYENKVNNENKTIKL